MNGPRNQEMSSIASVPSSPAPSSSASDDFAALVDAEIRAGSPFASLSDSECGIDDEEAQRVDEDEINEYETEDDENFEGRLEKGGVDKEPEPEPGASHFELQRKRMRTTEVVLNKRQRGVDHVLQVDLDTDDCCRVDNVQADAGSGGSCPPHPGFMWGVCIRCGELKPSDDSAENGVALRYIHEELELSKEEAARLRQDELKQVLSKGKLYLILDLDHTLLNSARFQEVPPEEQTFLSAVLRGVASGEAGKLPEASNATQTTGQEDCQKSGDGSGIGPNLTNAYNPAIQGGKQGLHMLPSFHMWTKLRPYVHKFLEQASSMFEMYVYTMGEKAYALAMAQLLDPLGRYFKGRVISKGDSTQRNIKDLDVVLSAESAVVILDDTEAVWPRHRDNLIVMERYHFFSSSCRQYGVESSLSKERKDESESNGGLATVLNVLRSIHEAFFNDFDQVKEGGVAASESVKDVRQVIPNLRAKTLMGCRVVYSRIFRVGLSNPELTPLWQLAEALGAQCLANIDDSVTHVVALDRGTDKAKWARQNGRFLVHPSWIDAAYYRWCRPNEADFPVGDSQTKVSRFGFSKTVDIGL